MSNNFLTIVSLHLCGLFQISNLFFHFFIVLGNFVNLHLVSSGMVVKLMENIETYIPGWMFIIRTWYWNTQKTGLMIIIPFSDCICGGNTDYFKINFVIRFVPGRDEWMECFEDIPDQCYNIEIGFLVDYFSCCQPCQ